MVMEHVSGGELFDYIVKHGKVMMVGCFDLICRYQVMSDVFLFVDIKLSVPQVISSSSWSWYPVVNYLII